MELLDTEMNAMNAMEASLKKEMKASLREEMKAMEASLREEMKAMEASLALMEVKIIKRPNHIEKESKDDEDLSVNIDTTDDIVFIHTESDTESDTESEKPVLKKRKYSMEDDAEEETVPISKTEQDFFQRCVQPHISEAEKIGALRPTIKFRLILWCLLNFSGKISLNSRLMSTWNCGKTLIACFHDQIKRDNASSEYLSVTKEFGLNNIKRGSKKLSNDIDFNKFLDMFNIYFPMKKKDRSI